jgi:transposase
MAQGKPRDLHKERQWRQYLRHWQASGLSVQAFCDRRGLTAATFYAWRRELRRRDAACTTFVPVHVAPDQVPAQTAGIEVVLGGGRRLRIGPGFDPATLRQLLAVLEEGPPC